MLSRAVMLSRAALFALLTLIAMAGAVVAGPIEDWQVPGIDGGSAAFRRGDYATAYRLLRPLAEQGNAVAQTSLGLLYTVGRKGSPWWDPVEAAKWWRKAADQGLDCAQYYLGAAYWGGQGVPRDLVQAYKWFDLALSRYPPSNEAIRQWAVMFRDDITGSMSPSQIAEAQKLASEWRPQSPKIALNEPTTTRTEKSSSPAGVALKKVGGTFVVPVEINGALTLDFTIDSGAADVTVPLDVYSTLMRKGTIKDSDVIGEQTYVLADGSTRQSITFVIRSLKVGDIVVENVTGSVGPMQGSLLLGQSFLERFKSWSIDNARHVLVLEPQ
jgi:clan AA aspartic protease (TIGR02281 family)